MKNDSYKLIYTVYTLKEKTEKNKEREKERERRKK